MSCIGESARSLLDGFGVSLDLRHDVREDAAPKAIVRRKHTPSASELFMYATPVVSAGAAVVAFASLAGFGPLRRRPLLGAALGLVASAVFAKSQFDRFITEQPRYTLERRIGSLEIRRYAPRMVAETRVASRDFDAALSEGFRRLAGFIFGKNVEKERLAMTTPVNAAERADDVLVRFQLPREKTPLTPVDETVTVRTLDEERVASLKVAGRYDAEHIERARRELLDRVRDAGLTPEGEVVFAGYDSPATLPLWRRTEVWVRVR
jgi:hypothetical protein